MENNKYIEIVPDTSAWFKEHILFLSYTAGKLEIFCPSGGYFCDWKRDTGTKIIIVYIPTEHVVGDDLLEAIELGLMKSGEGNIPREHFIICWSTIHETPSEAGESYVADDEGFCTCVYVGSKALECNLWVTKG